MAKASDWVLACTPCLEAGERFVMQDKTRLDAMRIHFDMEHPEVDKMAFTTVWVGEGPEPPKPVPNRAARRRQARRTHKGHHH